MTVRGTGRAMEKKQSFISLAQGFTICDVFYMIVVIHVLIKRLYGSRIFATICADPANVVGGDRLITANILILKITESCQSR